MITGKNQFLELTLSAITFVFVLGALALIWPGIMTLFFGVLLLFQSCSAEQKIAGLSWTEITNSSITFAS